MSYATHHDVAVELGRPDFTDETAINQVNAWIDRTEAYIRNRVPDLDDRVADGSLTALLVANVEAAVVARKVRNPEGLRQSTHAVDDGSITKLRDPARVVDDLALTEDEWALLDPPSGAFTIRATGTGPDAYYAPVWPNRRDDEWQ